MRTTATATPARRRPLRAALAGGALAATALVPLAAAPAQASTGGGSGSDSCSVGIKSITRPDAGHLTFRFQIVCQTVPLSTLRIAGTVQRGSTVVGVAQNNTCAGLTYCYSYPVTVSDPASTQTYYTIAEGYRDNGAEMRSTQTWYY